MGEHHRIGHKWSVYEPLVRVPLVVRAPGLEARRESRPVSTRQLWATVADLIDAPLPDGPLAASLLEGGDGFAVSEMNVPASKALERMAELHPGLDTSPWNTPLVAGQDASGNKLIIAPDGRVREGYALSHDPLETTPVPVPGLQERLEAALAPLPTYDPTLAGPDDQRKVDAATNKQLEALGYVDPGAAP